MKNIAVICTGLSIKAFQDVFLGIRECAVAGNSNVFYIAADNIVGTGHSYEAGEINVYDSIDLKLFDGVIFVNSSFPESTLASKVADIIEKSGIPAVCIEGNYPCMYNLRIDNFAAMRDVMMHLITDHGYKRIGFVTGPLEHSNEAVQRYECYKQTMNDFDLPFDENYVYEGDFTPNSGDVAAVYFIERLNQLPEAIVCSNDLMALSLIQQFNRRGIKVPEQVAVTGFDDMLQAKYSEPRLTSVSRDNYKSGYAACAKLINGIMPEEIGITKGLSTSIIKRESCGCTCRDEIDYKKLQRAYFEMNARNGALTIATKGLQADFSEVFDVNSLKEKMMPFVKRIGCDEFYLCLMNEWEGIHSDDETAAKYGVNELKDDYIRSGIGSGTYMMFGYATRGNRENSQFGVKELINAVNEKSAGRNCFVVTPVHFGDRVFGYSIISNCDNAFDNSYYQMWIQGIGTALELIRRKNVMDATMKRVDSLWIFDNLTGLYNRAGFAKYGTPIFKECMKEKKAATLFFVDLDDLKHVNDIHGHDAGDRFIKAMALILKKRKKHGEVIMRFGGDEFVILAMGLDEEGAGEYCSSIYSEVENYNKMHNLPSPLSVTIGYVVRIPNEGASLDDAIEDADKNMFVSKREKGNY